MRRLLAVVGLAGVCWLAVASSASAVPLLVNDTDDVAAEAPTTDGTCDAVGAAGCTLRAAIQESNGVVATAETITFTGTGEYILTLGTDLQILDQVTITGNGSGVTGTRISGNSTTRVFDIGVGTTTPVTLENLRIQDGFEDIGSGSNGGAGISSSGILTLNNVTVTGNTLNSAASGNARGAGIYQNQMAPTLTLNDSTVSDNFIGGTLISGSGGGIYTNGPLAMTNSTVDGNALNGGTTREGGGIYALNSYDITSSTISDNTEAASAGTGAGLFDASAGAGSTKSITNTTISGNSAGSAAGGAGGGARLSSNAAITNVTFANNTANGAGASLLVSANTATLKNTILAASFIANCDVTGGGMIASAGYNISNDASCNLSAGTNDQPTTSPGLDSLALNAPGTTETHALMLGSPAINMGDPAANCGAAITADQRGVARPEPAGGRCDVGAFELEHQTLTVSTVGSGTVTGTGIGCPGDCTEALPRGTMVALTPTPAAGFSFAGWSGACAGTGACNVTLSADKAVTATFTANPVIQPPPATTAPAAKKKCKKKKKKSAAAAKKCKKKK